MQIIAHRKNTVEELVATPVEYGVEMDIRSIGNRLVVTHDAFTDALDFEDWIAHYRHNTLSLNIKEEGIEYRVKEIVESHGIQNYFFLDLSFPYLVKMVNTGEKRVAVRFSEYESIETVLSLVGKAEWVWVDCFTRMPLDRAAYEKLAGKFRLCIVSPELQGYPVDTISEFKTMLIGFEIDAVCTKRPDLWLN